MHSKVVIWVTVILIIFGAVMIKLTNNITWLGALFNSVSARTAGFSTFNLSNFSNAGIIVMIVLMFIGASPGSTAGGIKTTTVFVLFKGIVSAATNKGEKAFKYAIQRPRPERLEQLSSFSFPSGHSMGGIIYLFTLAYIFSHYTTSQKRAYIVWLGAAILTILIGLSRIAESRHFGSDVLGGFSLGFAWFMLSVFWYEYRERVIKRQ